MPCGALSKNRSQAARRGYCVRRIDLIAKWYAVRKMRCNNCAKRLSMYCDAELGLSCCCVIENSVV